LFAACGCRDFARADVFLEPDGQFYFLEINTMPGMTETSLMPKSASCVGLDFPLLVRRMAAPALARAAQPVRL
jgi:D-alanine-D-alanine ligase